MFFERLALSKDTKAVMKMAKKDDIFARYVLGGLSNKVFVSKYKLALPSEKELREKLKSLPLCWKVKAKGKNSEHGKF